MNESVLPLRSAGPMGSILHVLGFGLVLTLGIFAYLTIRAARSVLKGGRTYKWVNLVADALPVCTFITTAILYGFLVLSHAVSHCRMALVSGYLIIVCALFNRHNSLFRNGDGRT